MDTWLAWGVVAIAAVVLGWVGYHFAVRTLRFATMAFALTVVLLVTRYGVTHPARTPGNLVNAFTRGMDKLTAVFVQPLLGHQFSAPGRAGWLVLMAVLVFAYRELEVWATRWQPPAADTSALGGNRPGPADGGAPGRRGDGRADGQSEHDKLVTELRFRLPAVEVRAPAILPGGARVNGLASVAENSGIAGSGLAGAIIRLAGMLWPSPRRYQVRVWLEPAGQRVTVDLEDPQTGMSIATKTLVACNVDEAAAVVAAYVARQIFKDDPTAPPWCVGSFDGDDLAALLLTEQLREPVRSSGDATDVRRRQIELLEKAVCNNLSSGVARYELAQLHDLEGHHLKALKLHAINRQQFPRFYRGRYRLGMSLEMIANPAFRLPGKERKNAAGLLEESLRILDRCGVTRQAAGRCVIAGDQLPAECAELLLTAARHELRTVSRQLTLPRVVWAMLWHRDERAIRKPYWRLGERQRFHDGARVAELLVTVRQHLTGPPCGRRERRHARKAMRITAAIAGDIAAIKTVLDPAKQDPPEHGGQGDKPWYPAAKADKTRWLPWLHRTPSWQAAYNAACLYAALADSPRYRLDLMAALARRCLERVVDDRNCEMERPSDWIGNDPDLLRLHHAEEFSNFLRDQERRDYPPGDPVVCRALTVGQTDRPAA